MQALAAAAVRGDEDEVRRLLQALDAEEAEQVQRSLEPGHADAAAAAAARRSVVSSPAETTPPLRPSLAAAQRLLQAGVERGVKSVVRAALNVGGADCNHPLPDRRRERRHRQCDGAGPAYSTVLEAAVRSALRPVAAAHPAREDASSGSALPSSASDAATQLRGVTERLSDASAEELAAARKHAQITLEIIAMLLEASPPPSSVSCGESLLIAAKFGCTPVVRLLLESSIIELDVNYVEPVFNNTALLLCAVRADPEMIDLLLRHGADPKHQNRQSATALHKVVANTQNTPRARCECVRLLVTAGASLSIGNKQGDTPLIKACRQGQWECVEVLLAMLSQKPTEPPSAATETATPSSSASAAAETSSTVQPPCCATQLSMRNAQGHSALHVAAECGHARIVRLLLEAGMQPDQRDAAQCTALMLCAGENAAEVVDQLLAAGADPLAVDAGGNTLLHRERACESVLALVLDRCSDAQRTHLLQSVNQENHTALDVSLRVPNLDVAQLLCARGATHKATTPEQLSVALILCASSHQYRVLLEYLIGAGADVNHVMGDRSALLVAAEHDIHENVHLLLKAGATASESIARRAWCSLSIWSLALLMKASSPKDWSPSAIDEMKAFRDPSSSLGLLHLAAGCGSEDCVRELLAVGFDLNLVSSLDPFVDGGSPLHIAVQKGQPACARLLLEAGAEVNSQTSYYEDTPAHVACHFDQPACLSVLLERGARTDLKNNQGESLSEVACQKSCDCLTILRQHK